MIFYASRTGNVRSIIDKLGLPSKEITHGLVVSEPYLLITYTDKLGGTPEMVDLFLKDNHQYCIGVAASGNSNFGSMVFCKSADNISKQYGVPIICKIELRGFQPDYDTIQDFYKKHFGKEASRWKNT